MSSITVPVIMTSAIVVVALTVPAAMLGGGPAGLGVLAGGALAILSFWSLAARATAACQALAGGRPGAAWLVSTSLRFVAVAAVCAILLVKGWVHPVALLVGITVLPCAVVAQGLRAAPKVS